MNSNKDNVLTVSNLTEYIKLIIKENIPSNLCVTGEISNYKQSKTNLFFTLKDSTSSINVAVWNNCHKDLNLSDGKQIKLWGNLVIFGKSGTYNLNAYKIELIGTGNLFTDYITLKDKYTDLGYFNESRKKELPKIITRVGIATALGGAALQDFMYIIKKNNFNGTIYVKNCVVQGKDCPTSVVKAIKELDTMSLDVIVLARGGGSFEDLCGFSDANIIEALYNCKTCTISAIGHEIDFMLSDFVADIRAPTPSIAGNIITQKPEDVYNLTYLTDLQSKINTMLITKIKFLEQDLTNINLRSPLKLIEEQVKNVKIIKNQLHNIISAKINNMNEILNGILIKDSKLSNYPEIYSMDNKKLTNMKDFIEAMNKRKKLKIKFEDGEAIFDVRNIK